MLKRDRLTVLNLALLATVIIWLLLLGYRSLFDPDEGRYAEIPREMVASGDWVTPRLDGFKYFEKPALQYWVTAATFEVLGDTNFAARLWPAVIGLVGAGFAGFVAWRLYGRRTGWYAFFLSASCFLYFGFGHFLSLDMTVSVFIFITLGCGLLAQHYRHSTPLLARNWMLAAWAAAACAVLSKGLIGVVLPAGAVFLYSLWQRDWQLWRHLHIIKGLLLFLLICAPWFVVVSLRNPEFAHFFFIHEHWERYTTTEHHRDAPVFYFLPILLLGSLPWIYHFTASLVKPAFSWLPRNPGTFDGGRLLWMYVVFIFVFFSLGHSKLPGYIVPIMPAIAILAARRMAHKPKLGREAILVGLVGGLFLVAAVLLPKIARHSAPIEVLRACQPWLYGLSAALLAAAAALYGLRKRVTRAVALASVLVMLGFHLLMWGGQELAAIRSAAGAAQAIIDGGKLSPIEVPDDQRVPVYLIDHHSPTLPFYLKREVVIVGHKGEMRMGIDLKPEAWVADKAAFLQEWNSHKLAYAVIRNKDYDNFFDPGMAVNIIYRDPKRCVVEKATPAE